MQGEKTASQRTVKAPSAEPYKISFSRGKSMALSKVPDPSLLVDGQFIQISGPDGMNTGFQYDAQQKALYWKESQVVIPSSHGITHISDDPVPDATTDTPGLMSADDKAKLDAITQTRVGILGYQGAGMPDDGGWMGGDIIFGAKGFMSIERIGNVVLFHVDSPLPLNCGCDSCTQIYWVQDEITTSSIRPPSCGGKLPGVNAYNEVRFYLMPESTILNNSNPSATLSQAGSYPALIFKRYNNTVTPNKGQFDLVLERDANNLSQSVVGWSMTPGPSGVPECQWQMGLDSDGGLITFEFESNDSGLLGYLLYNGHNLTRQAAVITNYTDTTMSNNVYKLKFWNIDTATAYGDEFTATNTWQYSSAESSPILITDPTVDILPRGTVVDVYFYKVAESNGEPVRRYYFNRRPSVNPTSIWSPIGTVEFGNELTARLEKDAGNPSAVASSVVVDDERNFEKTIWGLTGNPDPVTIFSEIGTEGPAPGDYINTDYKYTLDTAIPALTVPYTLGTEAVDWSRRPVMLWNRKAVASTYVKAYVGRPTVAGFPQDFIIHSPIDAYSEVYMTVVSFGSFTNPTVAENNYINVNNVNFNDLPSRGTVRFLINQGTWNSPTKYIWNYTKKALNGTSVALCGADPLPPIAANDVVTLLPEEYNSTCVRMECITSTSVQLQFKVGTLDMAVAYSEDVTDEIDDFVRGMSSGWMASSIYTQAATFDGSGAPPSVNNSGFVVYDGGSVSGTEYWNVLEIMQRGSEVWIWWNGLLVPPNSDLSDVTTEIDTPYFPVSLTESYGKFGMRMWPGASVRKVEVNGQVSNYSEYIHGQLSLV